MLKKIIIAEHHGFCMGVKRAIKIAEETSHANNGKVTILNEIVHNEAVVDQFKKQGVGQSISVDDVEKGTLIISAHGIAPDVIREAKKKGLEVVDATCPLVTKVHREAVRYASQGYTIVLVGHQGHDEVVGVLGEAPDSITLVALNLATEP